MAYLVRFMEFQSVNWEALLRIVLEWVAIIGAVYLAVLLVIRYSNLLVSSKCPTCGLRIKRSKTKREQRLLNMFSLGLLKFKRYRCYGCYWEGTLRETRRPRTKQP